MKRLICLLAFLLVAASLAAAWNEQQQQQKRILRRVIKSTPTATNLARVRLVTVRAADTNEKGAVSEISSKEAASFGQRSSNETSAQKTTPTTAAALKTKSAPSETPAQATPAKAPVATKTATPTSTPASSTTSSTTTTTSPPTTTSTTSAPAPALSPSSTPQSASPKSKASERQQAAPEVELMSSAQSSWQMMSAVEAPAAALISAGTRPAVRTEASNELATSSTSDFSRTYSSSRQQASKTRQQQASFYPSPPKELREGKTSTYQATKTQWYQPTTSTTTPRPAPLVQEPQYEQYVEQQVDSAPPGQAEPFAFDFNTQDTSGNGQYRKEESDKNGVVRGSYGFRDASGLYRHVDYVADHNGFRASIRSNEPGLEGGRDSQPASIKLDNGPAPARFTSSNNPDWTAASSSGLERADLAQADPDFESSHKAERIRVNFRD